MADLTPEEMAIINTALYMNSGQGSDTKFQSGMSLYEWAQNYKPAGSPGEIDIASQQAVQATILAHPEVYKDVVVKNVDIEPVGGDAVLNVSFTHGDDVIVAYKGTANDLEWADNGKGGYYDVTDTLQQQAALDFFDQETAGCTGDVFVTGHSKGGNKAQYVTLLRGDQVEHTYSFDGQGFNAAFLAKYSDEIEQYHDKITSIANEYDYVNILFNRVAGEVLFVDSSTDNPLDFKLWHSPISLFTVDGTVTMNGYVPQSPLSTEMQSLILFLEKYMEPQDFQYFCAKVMSFLIDDPQFADDIPMPDGFFDRLLPLIKNYGEIRGIDPADIMELLLPFFHGPQSILIPILLALGWSSIDSAGYSAIVRDFTDATKQMLLGIVQEVEDEHWWDITHWDIWYRVDHFFGGVDFPSDMSKLGDYYRKMIDMNGTTAKEIERIFAEVKQADADFAGKISNIRNDLKRIQQSITNIQDMVPR